MRRAIKIAFAVAFFLAIIVPFFGSFFNNATVSENEKRDLELFPKFDLRFLDKFPPQFNKYWGDHFGGRDQFITASHKIKRDYLGVSPIPDKVIFGEDNWYFMKGKPYKCYSGLNKFTPQQLALGRVELTKRAEYAKEMGIPYIIFIAPNKHRIYEEKLPYHVKRLTDSIQVEQLIALTKTIDGIEVVDLAPELIKAKDEFDKPIYQKADNHWNAVGGFLAYQQMVSKLQEYFFQIPEPYSYSDYAVKEQITNGGALARYLKSEKEITETQYPMNIWVDDYTLETDTNEKYEPLKGFWYPEEYEQRTINTRDSTLPKVLWFRDSFGRLVRPHLRHNVGYLVEIFDSWQYRLNPQIIANEKPDAVILLVLERNIACLMNGGDCEGNF
ncbi:MAG: hypothetical protein JXQ87_16875 [Bacteroidia bacterium]